MRRSLTSITILSLFLFTQFISMYGGLSLIACPGDFDNLDDISLEDIVPLDPFLSGNGLQISQSLPLGNGGPLLGPPHNWIESFAEEQPRKPLQLDRSQPVALKHGKGLWLVNQAILC
jgi:hypothetical protein